MARRIGWALASAAFLVGGGAALAQTVATATRTGPAAFGDWHSDAPGVRRLLQPNDLPTPLATPPSSAQSAHVSRPDNAQPKVPPGFSVSLMASGLKDPRVVRVAPNGDVFVAETEAGRVRVFHAGATDQTGDIYASGLRAPFGIAFYPPGPDPQFVYVANTTSVMRFPYRNGDTKATTAPEIIVQGLPSGGHSTRDLAFSPDGKTLYVSVGSSSNIGSGLDAKRSAAELADNDKQNGFGASWGADTDRAKVLAFDPDGHNKRSFATGLRNCAGLTIQPATGALWCAVNERDMLGDDVPFEYATHVEAGHFYGWPWYYNGDHADPRLKDARPDLASHVTVPDVLIQAHSAPLGLTFYDGPQFPADYKGDAFVALHGSWNRAKRTGYKVVRLLFRDGKPTGEYEDFATGFVTQDSGAWGRPVDVAVAKDGSLLVTEDENGTIWRISHAGP